MLNIPLEQERITSFIREYCRITGFKHLVIGLSGGIDSALSAALAVQAVGADNVFAVNIPYRNSHPDSAADANIVAKHLGLQLTTIDLSPMTDTYFDSYYPQASRLRRGNWMARIRMNVLYDFAALHNALVVGTGNRTELLVGYCTQYGDSACAFEPIGHLYKTEVWQMARYLMIPEKIITKTPTADLWEGQSDEEELGISYSDLDEILVHLTETFVQPDYPLETLNKVRQLIAGSEFKRNMPPVLERK
ncbi:MAG: NAD+ synthase [Candidatus Cloacimonetes bacterium]|nr:NAD+ synthase [Candidatus Cloacimonadota bacterium]